MYDNGVDNDVRPGSAGARCGAYYNTAIENDQYSQVVIVSSSSASTLGVAVRCAAGAETCYYWYGTDSDSWLRRLVGGAEATLATGDGFSAADVIQLEIVDYELRCYKNGALDTSIDGTGKYDDDAAGNKIASGYAGIMMYGATVNDRVDDWEGGDA